jgi:hypothetical protein
MRIGIVGARVADALAAGRSVVDFRGVTRGIAASNLVRL